MDLYLVWPSPAGAASLVLVACTFLLPLVSLFFFAKRKVSKQRGKKTRGMAANSAPTSGPIHLSLHSKLFSSANCGLVK